MYRLPSTDSPIRDLFDIEHVAEMLQPGNRLQLPAFGQVKREIRCKGLGEGIRSVNVVCMKADGSICLIEFGPKGGAKQLWKFC